MDWPSAGFFRELLQRHPRAKFILTHRSPESWADSFGATVYKLVGELDRAPPEMRDWLRMATQVIEKTGFPPGLEREDLMAAFVVHNEAVKSTIPAEQLLVYEVKQGWEPLCAFLDKEVPPDPFPRTNDRAEFWELVTGQR